MARKKLSLPQKLGLHGDTEKWIWAGVSMATGAAAGFLMRKSLEHGWKFWRGEPPPKNPAARETTWGDALLWSGVMGLFMGLVRVPSQRGAAGAWKKITHRKPPLKS